MKLTEIENDIRTLTTHLTRTLDQHLPTIAAAANDPIVQALENAAGIPMPARLAIAKLIDAIAAEHQPRPPLEPAHDVPGRQPHARQPLEPTQPPTMTP